MPNLEPNTPRDQLRTLWQRANVRAVRIALGTALSLLALWLAFRDVPLGQVLHAFSDADYRFVALGLGLVLISPLLRAARWRLLYHPHQRSLSFLSLTKALLIGQMLNIVVPARVGELARIHFARKLENLSRARTLGTIAVEKWLDVLMLLLLALTVPIFVSLPPWFRDSRISLVIVVVASLAIALALFYGQDRLLLLLQPLLRLLPGDWRVQAQRAVRETVGSLAVFKSPWTVLRLQAWSVSITALSIFVNHVIFSAMGMSLPFAAALFLLVVLEVGVAVPSAPGKLGVFHYLCVLALGVFGVQKAAAIAYAVLLHAVVFLPPSLLGALLLWWESVHGRKVPSANGPTSRSAASVPSQRPQREG